MLLCYRDNFKNGSLLDKQLWIKVQTATSLKENDFSTDVNGTKTKKKKKRGRSSLWSEEVCCRSAVDASWLPELQQAVLAVGADEVLVGVVGDADHVLLVDLEGGAAMCQHQPSQADFIYIIQNKKKHYHLFKIMFGAKQPKKYPYAAI